MENELSNTLNSPDYLYDSISPDFGKPTVQDRFDCLKIVPEFLGNNQLPLLEITFHDDSSCNNASAAGADTLTGARIREAEQKEAESRKEKTNEIESRRERMSAAHDAISELVGPEGLKELTAARLAKIKKIFDNFCATGERAQLLVDEINNDSRFQKLDYLCVIKTDSGSKLHFLYKGIDIPLERKK